MLTRFLAALALCIPLAAMAQSVQRFAELGAEPLGRIIRDLGIKLQ